MTRPSYIRRNPNPSTSSLSPRRKKSLNAYIVFYRIYKKMLKEIGDNSPPHKVASITGKMWRNFSNNEKNIYYVHAHNEAQIENRTAHNLIPPPMNNPSMDLVFINVSTQTPDESSSSPEELLNDDLSYEYLLNLFVNID
ncbi:hypothetical protein C1645_813649 [Glomus cerebriforme]|uniref:HMG box domain-containing protein n=1 Tax=Glomus cerebriforme TaxID=658196 RepID=A0A397TLI3_9GLOM|nr:hypothetical protein C1645_813649 [Glomus cerebriforme]